MENNVITPIIKDFREVYEIYKNKGLRAIYLWGSITTKDFDIKTSDVDGIGIIDDEIDMNIENEIKHELEMRHPEITKFGFRVTCEGELRGEIKPKFPLATSIPPRLLLLDLHNWIFVAGKKYSMVDFTNTPPMFEEGLYWRLEQLKNKGWDISENVENGKEQCFLKILWRIVYLFQLLRGLDGSFSYYFVITHADKKEKIFVDAMQVVKNSGYKREDFINFIPVFNELLVVVRQKAIKP